MLWLGEMECHDPFLVGGKAASLSRLAEHHPVPPGFVVTTRAFEPLSTGELPVWGWDAGGRHSPLAEEIALAHQHLATESGIVAPQLAVRSSAVDEDGGDASFAGQHETFLNISGLDALFDAVGRCWSSFVAPHAIEYRRRQGLPTEGVRVAILIQRLVVADTSAVVFTADPVTGSRDHVVVNAAWGLGESIVGGAVTPDVYVVAKDGVKVERRHVSAKRRMTVAVPGGTTEVVVPGSLAEQPALGDEQILDVARLGLSLESISGRPVDIECCHRSGRLYLLQCRPITTLGAERPDMKPSLGADALAGGLADTSAPALEPVPVPPGFPVAWGAPEDAELLWTRDPVHWPDPLPVLVFEVAGGAVARGLTAAARAYELPVAEVRTKRVNTYRYQANVPLRSPLHDAEVRAERSRRKLRAAMSGLRTRWSEEWLPEVKEHIAFWDGVDPSSLSTAALLEHLDETLVRLDRLWEIHFLLSSPMHASIGQFAKLHRELFGGGSLAAFRLLKGLENETVRAGRALWQLGRAAMGSPEVRAALEKEDCDPLEELAASAQGRDFLAQLESYLQEFGQRGDGLRPDRPSWLEDPAPVLADLRGFVAQSDRDLEAEMAATGAERERLVGEARRVLEGYPGPVVQEFEFLLAAAQSSVALSEDHNFWIDSAAMQRVRQVFVELGRRLAAAAAIPGPDDVFHLTLDELRRTAAASPPPPRHELVADRRREIERYRGVSPPAMLGSRTAGEPSRSTLLQRRRDAQALRGSAGSPGTGRGPARVLRSHSEGLRPGEVLVAPTLSSSWTPLFAIAAAVVTDTGGILSHAAVVAREYGVPAVLGTEVATSVLRDGRMVEVDGDHGIVRLLDGPG